MSDEKLAEVPYTSAEDWPTDDGGQDLVLPSGAKVRVAIPPIFWLAMTGRIPPHIMAIAKHHQADKSEWSTEESATALYWLICLSFVDPKLSLTRKAGCLHIAKLSDADKGTVAATLKLQTYAASIR